MRALSVVFLVGLAVGVERGAHPVPANPRELPSLSERWTWNGTAEDAVLAADVVYVRGQDRVAAINADSGKVLWEAICARGGDLVGEGPVLDSGKVAVSFGGNLALLDRQTGHIEKTVRLGVVFKIVGPPLLVVAEGKKDRVDLVRIDPDSGEILARREVGRIVYDAKMAGSLAVALVDQATLGSGESDEILAAYRIEGLSEAWRTAFEGVPELEWVDGSLYAADTGGEDENSRKVYRRIETDSGHLGPTLPQRVESCVSGGLTWELEVVGLKEGSNPARLRRNSTETGLPLWTADLPGDVRGWVRDGDALYLHCEHEGGRGYFLVLDWTTGAVRQAAYGLRDVRGLFSHGDDVIAWQEEGLTAFAARSFGPPDSSPRSLREEVEKILRGVKDGDLPVDRHEHVQAAVTDLKTLGPRALPFVAEQVPRLDAVALLAAARVLGYGGYREAASSLAARLGEQPPQPKEWDAWDPAFDVLKALSQIGGEPEVGRVAGILNDSARAGSTRRQALATLASIATPAAVRALQATLSARPSAERWWQPPNPEGFAALIGRTDLKLLEEQARDRQDWDEMERIEQATAGARVPLPGGDALVVFHDPRIGGDKDLWVAEVSSTGRVGAAHFIGGFAEGVIGASLEGDVLLIGRAGDTRTLRVDLSEIGKDSDGDGLPDMVEVRLATDPNNPDTDGDGFPDSGDPAPNGAGMPETEEQQIIHSVFQQFFMFEGADTEHGLESAIMVSHSALQWLGRRGSTITLDPVQDEQFLKEAGSDGIAHISIGPGRQAMGRNEAEPEDDSLGPDERWYQLTIYRGGLDAVGYDILVRRLGDLWVIKECRFAWVS